MWFRVWRHLFRNTRTFPIMEPEGSWDLPDITEFLVIGRMMLWQHQRITRYAAKYGVFDTAAEKEAAAPVIEALKSAGWEFACNGYDGTNYGSDEEAVSADLTKWNESVGTLVGNTTILLFPSGTDSRGWKAYDESDPVYQILKKQGFLYYGSMDISGTKTQLTEQYLRCSYLNVDGYRMYQDLYKDAGRFTGILDFQEIYDSKRPMAANETDTQATGGEDEKV